MATFPILYPSISRLGVRWSFLFVPFVLNAARVFVLSGYLRLLPIRNANDLGIDPVIKICIPFVVTNLLFILSPSFNEPYQFCSKKNPGLAGERTINSTSLKFV